jgi:hypothetical protein
MASKKYSLSVADGHLDRMPEIAREAEAAGLRIESRLEAVGVLTGSAAPDAVERLRGIPGVEAVEEEREVRIAPPGSRIQ